MSAVPTPEVLQAAVDAIEEHDVDTLTRLLKESPTLATQLVFGVVSLGNLELLRGTLAAGADANATAGGYWNGTTVLNEVLEVFKDDLIEAVRLLLDHGADPNAQDPMGRSALHCLAELKAWGKWDGEKEAAHHLLLRHGARYDSLPVAAALGSLGDVEALLADGADPDDESKYLERNAAHIAAQFGRIEILQALLPHMQYLDSLEKDGRTPLDLASDDAIRKQLRDAGAMTSDEVADLVAAAWVDLSALSRRR